MTDAGITVSRPWLTQIGQQGIALLEPIYEAQMASIRSSRVKAMDETPIKAGRAGPGKLKAAYFWPVYGELDEVCFPFFEGRRAEHIAEALGLSPAERAVLLTDGYGAYTHYANKTGITHAQCWAHTRRELFEAQAADPTVAAQGIDFIGALYAVETQIRDQKLASAKKLDFRLMHAKPKVEQFFAWVDQQFEAHSLVDDQRPRMTEMRIGIGDQLPAHTTSIPGGFAQHVVEPLIMTAADDLGHLLHVASPALEQAVEIAARLVLDRTGTALEPGSVGKEVQIEMRERGSNQLGNAIWVFELTSYSSNKHENTL